MVEIGNRGKIGKRHVSEIVRLAFLAPDIVDQIITGVQSPELTANRLLQKVRSTPTRLGVAIQVSGDWSVRPS